MPLIIEGRLEKDIFSRPGKHVGIYLYIPQKYLSTPYNLKLSNYYDIEGEILDIKKFYGVLEKDEIKIREVIGKNINFVLYVGFFNDYLYITENSWPLLRDYGVLPEDYVLKVKLLRIKVDNNVIDIYPKRDIVVK
jgi:hypothetical protein